MGSLTASEMTFIVIVGVVLMCAALCNILVVVVMVLTPKLRNPTNMLICNLAVSDLLLASIVLPQNLHDISHDDNYYEGDFLCRIVYVCPLLCIMASIYSMVAISFDRAQAILLNIDHRLRLRGVLLQLGSIWAVSFVFSVPTLYEHSEYEIKDPGLNATLTRCGSNGVSYAYSVVNGVGLLVVAYVVPLIILLFNYGKILMFFKAKGMFGKQSEERGAVFQGLYKTRMTVVKMLILVALLFAVSWAPYFVLLLIEKVSGISDTEYSSGVGNLLKIALSAFSTAYNFAVYIIYNNNFRLGVINLLGISKRSGCCGKRVVPSSQMEFVVTQNQESVT